MFSISHNYQVCKKNCGKQGFTKENGHDKIAANATNGLKKELLCSGLPLGVIFCMPACCNSGFHPGNVWPIADKYGWRDVFAAAIIRILPSPTLERFFRTKDERREARLQKHTKQET